jgi:hypothetical protein
VSILVDELVKNLSNNPQVRMKDGKFYIAKPCPFYFSAGIADFIWGVRYVVPLRIKNAWKVLTGKKFHFAKNPFILDPVMTASKVKILKEELDGNIIEYVKLCREDLND